ncbi:LptF/LptG family permease [Cyclobacteriaceae bacterium]|jgi:lipopolysaccharide export system permease protein|nr:LptF/LptG family permease [Cyclobacteriaceae bacterium]MDC1517464.1 LptF/LptG family permease [Cyclobacteriaceae bacterium]|tara:strand:+ start:410 stop:2077 length:1668 start_codon:yes stop_codon:yes gene_type:complete
MRRLDKLILKSFIGPFFLTTIVATFILLIQYMLKYFDDFVGKNLGFKVFAELLFYFSINILPNALPLGVLISSLMTFGSLGENFELSAIKSAGISLTRTLRPIFFFILVLTVVAFFFNNYVVPAANLKAYSLIYDIKHQKPALDIKKGVFYNGIPNYSIKANEKFNDNVTLKDVMIYDHTRKNGNNFVILADSSRMFSMYNDKYLKLELFDGQYFNQQATKNNRVDQFQRTSFDQMYMMFSLSSFDLKRTREELFQNNRQMKNIEELTSDIDSLQLEQELAITGLHKLSKQYLYHRLDRESYQNEKHDKKDSLKSKSNTQIENNGQQNQSRKAKASLINLNFSSRIAFSQSRDSIILEDVPLTSRQKIRKEAGGTYLLPENQLSKLGKMNLKDLDSLFITARKRGLILQWALSKSRNHKVNISSSKSKLVRLEFESERYKIAKFKKYSQAFACMVMFLIGAPLGAIIKKGGLGFPVIISIFFYIFYYVASILSEKWATAGFVNGAYSVWMADLMLLPIGLFFLRQARVDARLFDTDYYSVMIDKFKQRLSKKLKH